MTMEQVRRVPPAELGPILRAARARAGFGLREAARDIGISSGYLADLERGIRCPSVPVAADLHRVLHLTNDEARLLAASAVEGRGRAHPYRVVRSQ